MRQTYTALLAFLLAVPAWGQLRVTVISDLNGHYGSRRYEATVPRAVARILEMKPDLVLSLGDMVAGERRRPRLTRRGLEPMWGAFHRLVSNPIRLAGIPLAVVPGNHDASAYAGYEEDRRIFREQWEARRPQVQFVASDQYPFQYAFSAGGVLFAGLDGTITGPFPAATRSWLRELLAARGGAYRWRVVFTHVPLFPFAGADQRETVSDPEMEAVFREGKVDLVLSGHHHAYYHGWSDGILWVSQACIGAGPRALRGMRTVSPRAITTIEFPAVGPLVIRALRAPDFREPLDLRELPTSIRSPYRELRRLDLAAGPR